MPGIEELKEKFESLLLTSDALTASAWVSDVLQANPDPLAFFQNIFTPTMKAIGDKFSTLEIFLPELMAAAGIAQVVVDERIKPALTSQGKSSLLSQGKVLIGSAKGDLHDIGKKMVVIMLQVNGFEVIDAGVDVSPRSFVDRALETGAQIVGVSSLMTTSMPYMKEVIEIRDGLGHHDKFAVVVGGAPITPEYASSIGADGFGRDAIEATEMCLSVIRSRA